MAVNTTRLGLLKKDPVVDGNDTFNIKTMLNDNWDALDTKVETITGAQAKADVAKADAISAAATDATSKANTAEANAKSASVLLTQKGVASGVPTLDSSGNLVQKPYVAGTYTGNGAASQDIVLGFEPSAVLVTSKEGETMWGDALNSNYLFYEGGLAIKNSPLTHTSYGDIVLVVPNGFRVFLNYVSGKGVLTNATGTHHYIAYR